MASFDRAKRLGIDPALVDAEMARELDAHKVQYAGRFQSDLVPMILSWVLPIVLMVYFWNFISKRIGQAGQGAPLGRALERGGNGPGLQVFVGVRSPEKNGGPM